MDKHLHLPDPGHLSTISASIVISYALLPFLRAPARQFGFSVFGFLFSFQLNFFNLISLLTAAMAASGMDWLLRDHPQIKEKSTLPHLFLPALTAAAIGFPLGLIEISPSWWVIMGLGSMLVVLIFVAEYISMDENDIRYPLALMVLSAVSYSLFLIIAIAMRMADIRLFLMLLTIPPAYAFFCLRILKFRLGGRWRFEWAAVLSLILAQVLIALFYWPLSPIRFGLLLLGPAYGLVGIAASLVEHPQERVYLEPVVLTGVFWLLGILLG